MTTCVLERPVEELAPETEITSENKEELCRKLCMNIFEGLLEGYEELKMKNPEQAEEFEMKIRELKSGIESQTAV